MAGADSGQGTHYLSSRQSRHQSKVCAISRKE